MKNITLSVDDEVLAVVRRFASERNTTVNGLVRDYLTRIAAQEDKAAKARAKLAELSAKSAGDMGDWKWNREDIYDRGLLPGHERAGLRGFSEPDAGSEEEKGG